MEAYAHREADSPFFKTVGFTKHAGTEKLQEQIEAGWTAAQIRQSWSEKLQAFQAIRGRYLLYD